MLHMSISEERLNEFIRIWEEVYGERLSVGEARETAGRLVRFYRLITRPLPENPAAEAAPEAPSSDRA